MKVSWKTSVLQVLQETRRGTSQEKESVRGYPTLPKDSDTILFLPPCLSPFLLTQPGKAGQSVEEVGIERRNEGKPKL